MQRLSSDDASCRNSLQILVKRAASNPEGIVISDFIPEPLARCAAGEISPELALMKLLSQLRSEQTELALGNAIWNALENREAVRAERLAQVQRLWDRMRQTVQNALDRL